MIVNKIYEKGSGKLNEDNFIIKKNLFGVFDGAGDLNKWRSKSGKTGGYLASFIAKSVFEKNNDSLINHAINANKKINSEMLSAGIDINKKINRWSTAIAVVRINKNNFDWVQIGDSLILVIYRNGKHRLVSKHLDHDEKLLTIWKKLANKKVENIWAKISKRSIKLRETMNIKYGTLNGEKEMLKFLKYGKNGLKNIKHIILFTDGFFIPKNDPKEKEDWNKFVKLFNKGGLKKIRTHIRSIEKKDKQCWKYPRYKQHDDMTSISISF